MRRQPTPRVLVREHRVAYAFAAPAACFLLLFALLPFLYSVWQSFLSYDLQQPALKGSFIGLDNYRRLLADDPLFYKALVNTGLFIVVGLLIEFPLGFAIAAYLQHLPAKLRKLVLTWLIVPMVVAPVAVGMMWKFLINPQYGVLTYAFDSIGIHIQNALSDPTAALWTVRLIDVWQWTPFTVLLFQACLTSVPPDLLEAAAVDGLSTWTKYRHILIPWVLPTMTIAIVLRLLEAFKIFDAIYVLTEGGPGNATEMVSLYAHRIAFMRGDYSYAAADVVVLNIIVIAFCWILLRLVQKPTGAIR